MSYKNFDEAVNEADDAKDYFQGSWEEYNVPAQLPAKVILTQLRLANDMGEVGTKNIGEWLKALLGDEIYDELLDSGITWTKLEELLTWLLEEYGILPNADDEESEGGEEEAPK